MPANAEDGGDDCTDSAYLAGICGSTTGSGVDLDAWEQWYLDNPDAPVPGSGDGIPVVWDSEPVPAPPPPPVIDDCRPTLGTDCQIGSDEPAPADVLVLLRDIASFRPVVPADLMEPDGWGLVGRPVNLVSGASEQVVAGTLLGRPAEVRFTPIAWRWQYGDGAAGESTTPGATWAQAGQADFTPTATSHVYAERGTYEVAPSVVFSAAYRFDGSGWRAISGTVEVAGAPRSVLIGEVDTVLVAGDCRARPSGPGC